MKVVPPVCLDNSFRWWSVEFCLIGAFAFTISSKFFFLSQVLRRNIRTVNLLFVIMLSSPLITKDWIESLVFYCFLVHKVRNSKSAILFLYDIVPVIIPSLKSCAEDEFQNAIYWRWPVIFFNPSTVVEETTLSYVVQMAWLFCFVSGFLLSFPLLVTTYSAWIFFKISLMTGRFHVLAFSFFRCRNNS